MKPAKSKLSKPKKAMSANTQHYLGGLLFTLGAGCLFWSQFLQSFLFWLSITGGGLALCFFVRYLIIEFTDTSTERIDQSAVLVGTSGFSLLLMEGLILAYAHLSVADPEAALPRHPPLLADGAYSEEAHAAMKARHGVVTMPESWARRQADNSKDYYWHNVLHEHGDHNFRRKAPFPEKSADKLRIMVVGDSLTYGYGIASEHTYAAILQRLLSKQYRVEVLNLGVSGYQSEDTLRNMQYFLPQLEPDLVIYGICLNDYLPSGIGQAASDQYAVPLPHAWKQFFIARTRVGQLLNDGYHQLLLQADLRLDFYDDILRDFDGYQARFRSDVTAMVELTETHRTPFVTMVLHQTPKLGERTHEIILATEEHLAASGASLITTAPFLEAYRDQVLKVSKWEGHPNELANAIFASMLLPAVERAVDLSRYERQ